MKKYNRQFNKSLKESEYNDRLIKEMMKYSPTEIFGSVIQCFKKRGIISDLGSKYWDMFLRIDGALEDRQEKLNNE